MLGFLDLLGTIGGSILGLPGILGVALGMTTRKWAIGAGLGGMIGVLAPLVLGGSHSTHVPVTAMEYTISIIIGLIAGLAGCAIRRKGATV